MPHPVQYVVVLIVVFGMTHLLVDLFHQAGEELPHWLTPRLAAMIVTFFVALLWMLKALQPAPAPMY